MTGCLPRDFAEPEAEVGSPRESLPFVRVPPRRPRPSPPRPPVLTSPLRPGDRLLRLRLVRALSADDRLEEARTVSAALAAELPGDLAVQERHADLLTRLQDLPAAREQWVRVLALDPGFRTGCKVAAIDRTGKLRYIQIGPFNSAAEIKAIIDPLLAEK